MSEQFIRTDDGLINLRSVVIIRQWVKVEPTPRNPRTERARVVYFDGEDRETTYADPENIEHVVSPLIPATPGYFILGVYDDAPFEVYRTPVIAWRIFGKDSEPVGVEGITDPLMALLEPSGKVTGCGGGPCFDSVDEWRQYRIEQIQRDAAERQALASVA